MSKDTSPVCMHMFGAHRDPKKGASNSLGLKLQMALSHHMGSGTLTWVLLKSNPDSWLLLYLSSPTEVYRCNDFIL